ncbi:MAG: methyl-accepting chemotaxis protein [Kangiellaceae bacterium]|nr:methyl-accepting chemotaxis protein [Kangiellaceae bacterium]
MSNHTQSELEGLVLFNAINTKQKHLIELIAEDMTWRSGQTAPANQSQKFDAFNKSLNALADSELLNQEQQVIFRQALKRATSSIGQQSSKVGNTQWSAVDNYEMLATGLYQFNNLYSTVANLKGLTNDPEVDTVMLARLLVEKRLIILDPIARSYAVTAFALGEGDVSSGTFDSLSLVSDKLAASVVSINNMSSFSEGQDAELAGLIKKDIGFMLKATDDLIIFLEDQFLVAEEVTLDHTATQSFFNQLLRQYYSTGQEYSVLLESRLQHRLDTNAANRLAVTIVALSVLLLVIYLFIGMSLSISMTTASLSNVAQKLANGDTRVSAQVRTKDELATAIKAFNQMAVKVHDLVESVQQAAQGVATQSQNVEHLANQTGNAVETQLNDTQAITGAIAELLDIVALVSSNTQQVVEALNTANQQTLAGRDTLAGARRATNELGEEIKQSVEVINSLSQQSDSINQVLDVIKSIAEQTNLLALNAAIEAARAGEQGRGFAVVADEVRSLAKRTHQSIEEIQNTISSLQQGVSNAVEAMTKSDQKAHRSIEESAKLELALDQITQAVEQISQQNAATEQASSQQQGIANQIEGSLQSINQISSVTEKNVAQSIEASQQLAEHVAKLEQYVDSFKT